MFNKEKYQKCIGHLVSQKFTVIFVYLLIFAAIGVVVGSIFMFGLNRNETALYVGIGVGLIIGLIVGISSVWKIDMKIQEALPIDELIPKKSKVEEEIEKIDPLEITPIEALNILYKLKQDVK